MLQGIGKDGHVIAEGLESDHWVALDIGKKDLSLILQFYWQIGKENLYLFIKMNNEYLQLLVFHENLCLIV